MITDKIGPHHLEPMSRPYWINWPAHQLHSGATALMTGLTFLKAFWREIRTPNSSCLHAREP